MKARKRLDAGPAVLAAGEVPWLIPAEGVAAERDAYLSAHLIAEGPPINAAAEPPGMRLNGARPLHLFAAARHDPDPEVRRSALRDAVAYVRDQLAISLDRALNGPMYQSGRPALLRDQSTRLRWSTHGISKFNTRGPLRASALALGADYDDDDGRTLQVVPLLEDALTELIEQAEALGLGVGREVGGHVQFIDGRNGAQEGSSA